MYCPRFLTACLDPGPKGTFLYSNYRFIETLYLPLPRLTSWSAEMTTKLLCFKRYGVQGESLEAVSTKSSKLLNCVGPLMVTLCG